MAIVWWQKTEKKAICSLLNNKLQKQVCLGITSAVSTCPSAKTEKILRLDSLDLYVKRRQIYQCQE